jgi:hypothetical protein
MAVDLVFAPETELDIAEAYTWYERRRAGRAVTARFLLIRNPALTDGAGFGQRWVSAQGFSKEIKSCGR